MRREIPYHCLVSIIQEFVRLRRAILSGLYNCGLFNNVHFAETFTLRNAGETSESYETARFVKSATWIIDHLKDIASVKVLVDTLIPGMNIEDQILVGVRYHIE